MSEQSIILCNFFLYLRYLNAIIVQISCLGLQLKISVTVSEFMSKSTTDYHTVSQSVSQSSEHGIQLFTSELLPED
jgi:hypothetical protein